MTFRINLESAIAGLQLLLATNESQENEFQQWLEMHEIVFQVLGFSRVIPHPSLPTGETALIPDFLVQRQSGVWEFFEIKRPDTNVLKDKKTRSSFYSSTEEYISQCSEYAERCSQEAVQAYLKEKYGIAINSNPVSTIVAGRSAELDRLKVHNLSARRTPKVQIITYDDLLESLEKSHLLHFGNEEDKPDGISVYLATSFINDSYFHTVQTIFDIGESQDKNRVTLYRTGDLIARLRVIDDSRLQSIEDIDLSPYTVDSIFFIGIHIISQNEWSTILLEVNGVYAIEKRLPAKNIKISHPIPMTIGADIDGKLHANIITGSFTSLSPPLGGVERCLLREYMFDQIWSEEEKNKQTYGLTFANGQYMYTEGHPFHSKGNRSYNLQQANLDLRPHLSTWETDSNIIQIGAPIGLMKSQGGIKTEVQHPGVQ